MKISMNARKATRTKGRGRIRGTNHKQNYVRWGRAYYVKNRSRILRRARERYRKNRRKYAVTRAKWERKTRGGTVPLYLNGKGKRPVYPRLKPLHRKAVGAKTKSAKKLWRTKFGRGR